MTLFPYTTLFRSPFAFDTLPTAGTVTKCDLAFPPNFLLPNSSGLNIFPLFLPFFATDSAKIKQQNTQNKCIRKAKTKREHTQYTNVFNLNHYVSVQKHYVIQELYSEKDHITYAKTQLSENHE